MGVSFSMQSVAGRSKKDAVVTGRQALQTRLLVDFAVAVSEEGLDEPEDASLDWAEGQDYDDPVVPRECHPADRVVAGLMWLKDLAAAGEDPSESVWLEHCDGPFNARAFSQRLAVDLDPALEFCRQAHTRGDRILGVWIP